MITATAFTTSEAVLKMACQCTRALCHTHLTLQVIPQATGCLYWLLRNQVFSPFFSATAALSSWAQRVFKGSERCLLDLTQFDPPASVNRQSPDKLGPGAFTLVLGTLQRPSCGESLFSSTRPLSCDELGLYARLIPVIKCP